jgi:hypothetical protein
MTDLPGAANNLVFKIGRMQLAETGLRRSAHHETSRP